MANLTINTTLSNNMSLYDTQGAIIYILCVSIWYAIGFGLILYTDIGVRKERIKKYKYTNIYQAVNELHEQKARNDILIELKDKDRRKKLWDIYCGNEKTSLLTIEKDEETVNTIIKQLHELNEQRRSLQSTLYNMSLDQSDEDSTESYNSFQQNKTE